MSHELSSGWRIAFFSLSGEGSEIIRGLTLAFLDKGFKAGEAGVFSFFCTFGGEIGLRCGEEAARKLAIFPTWIRRLERASAVFCCCSAKDVIVDVSLSRVGPMILSMAF